MDWRYLAVGGDAPVSRELANVIWRTPIRLEVKFRTGRRATRPYLEIVSRSTEGIMKTLLATALLLGASSLMTAHAEWEILDPGMPLSAQVASPAPVTNTTSIAPATNKIETAKREAATR
jgi:hypothetical protein